MVNGRLVGVMGVLLAVHDSVVSAEDGVLRIVCTGSDPYIHGPGFEVAGPVSVRLRMKSTVGGDGVY